MLQDGDGEAGGFLYWVLSQKTSAYSFILVRLKLILIIILNTSPTTTMLQDGDEEAGGFLYWVLVLIIILNVM